MKKKVILAAFAALLTAGILTGCGNQEKEITDDMEIMTGDSLEINPEEGETEGTEEPQNATVEMKGTVTVLAGATPYGEILEQAKPLLAAKGWELEVTILDDYVQADEAVENGEYDACYVQTISDLESFNKEKGAHLVNAAEIHYGMSETITETEPDSADVTGGGMIAEQEEGIEANGQSNSQQAGNNVNIIVVKEGNEENEGIQVLIEILKSDEIRSFMENTYDGAIIACE